MQLGVLKLCGLTIDSPDGAGGERKEALNLLDTHFHLEISRGNSKGIERARIVTGIARAGAGMGHYLGLLA